jgi:large subunit ribosomal protein L32e
MAKEDVIKEFSSLNGIGKAKAELIYNSGFDSLEKLGKASFEDLVKIKGINEKFAKDIKDQLKKEAGINSEKKSEKPQSKPEKTVEKKGTPETKTKEEKPKTARKEEKDIEIIEEEEEGTYLVKKKPELSKELKEKLIIRKQIKKRTPDFIREEWFRYKRIPRNWRRPDGITSKMRINLKYRPNKVRVGYRGPKETRGLHSSGFEEIAVYNLKDIENIDPKTQAARIGSTVGTKKRIEIEKKAEELDVRVLNRS